MSQKTRKQVTTIGFTAAQMEGMRYVNKRDGIPRAEVVRRAVTNHLIDMEIPRRIKESLAKEIS